MEMANENVNMPAKKKRSAMRAAAENVASDALEGVPMEFALSGSGGVSDSTIRGQQMGMIYFNCFLKVKNMKQFNELHESEVCSMDLFRQFGGYLIQCFRKSATDENILMVGTVLQYFSNTKNAIMKVFKNNPIWKLTDEWTSIRLDIDVQIRREFIKQGIPIAIKSKGIGRTVLSRICNHYIQLGI